MGKAGDGSRLAWDFVADKQKIVFPNALQRDLVFFLGGLGVVDCLRVVFVLRFSNRVVALSVG